MEALKVDTDITKYGTELFKKYSETVFANNYEKLLEFYDENAVLLEKGKTSYSGPKEIIDAIKAYHEKLGPSSTENFNFNVEHAGNIIIISSKYRVQSVVREKIIEGEYTQFWKCIIGSAPKIIRDEFTIEKQY